MLNLVLLMCVSRGNFCLIKFLSQKLAPLEPLAGPCGTFLLEAKNHFVGCELPGCSFTAISWTLCWAPLGGQTGLMRFYSFHKESENRKPCPQLFGPKVELRRRVVELRMLGVFWLVGCDAVCEPQAKTAWKAGLGSERWLLAKLYSCGHWPSYVN